MIRRVSSAMSRGLITWFCAGHPVELTRLLSVNPSSRALRFIASANAASEPDNASATTMQASLPDWTTIPRIRSSTRTCLSTSTNILEPPIRQALRLTTNLSSSERCPAFSWSKTM